MTNEELREEVKTQVEGYFETDFPSEDDSQIMVEFEFEGMQIEVCANVWVVINHDRGTHDIPPSDSGKVYWDIESVDMWDKDGNEIKTDCKFNDIEGVYKF